MHRIFFSLLLLCCSSVISAADVLLRFPCPAVPDSRCPAWIWDRALQIYTPDSIAMPCFIVLLRRPDSVFMDAWVKYSGRPPLSKFADDMTARIEPDRRISFSPDSGRTYWRVTDPGAVYRGERLLRYEEQKPSGSAGDVMASFQKTADGIFLYVRRRGKTGHSDDLPLEQGTECACIFLHSNAVPKLSDFQFRPYQDFLAPQSRRCP